MFLNPGNIVSLHIIFQETVPSVLGSNSRNNSVGGVNVLFTEGVTLKIMLFGGNRIKSSKCVEFIQSR